MTAVSRGIMKSTSPSSGDLRSDRSCRPNGIHRVALNGLFDDVLMGKYAPNGELRMKPWIASRE